jgi:hypothetical protein
MARYLEQQILAHNLEHGPNGSAAWPVVLAQTQFYRTHTPFVLNFAFLQRVLEMSCEAANSSWLSSRAELGIEKWRNRNSGMSPAFLLAYFTCQIQSPVFPHDGWSDGQLLACTSGEGAVIESSHGKIPVVCRVGVYRPGFGLLTDPISPLLVTISTLTGAFCRAFHAYPCGLSFQKHVQFG